MRRVQRPTIQPNIRPVPALLDKPLGRIVAGRAQTLERPQPEPVHVAMVRLDVVADGCGRDDAALEAVLAKRVLKKLVPADTGPAGGAVPGVPFHTLTTNTQGSARQLQRESPRPRSARRRSYARVRRRNADRTRSGEGFAGGCSRAKSIAVCAASTRSSATRRSMSAARWSRSRGAVMAQRARPNQYEKSDHAVSRAVSPSFPREE